MFGKSICAMVFIVDMIGVLFEMYKHFQGEHRYHFLYEAAFTFGISVFMLAHYFLARRYFFFNKIFACFQTFICTIGITEKALFGGMIVEELDIFIVLL